MEQLLNEVQTISESYKRVADATGENFNLFSILQIESDEVTTHSRFIAELLNPNGRHGQKDIFLKRFKDIFNIGDFNTETAKVYVEYVISPISEDLKTGGRIDILVKSGDKAFMIENKIYAEEQPYQLLRYKNAFPDSTLFYLTLFGEESSEKGLINNKSSEKESSLYEKISYSDDIINWLEECKRDAVNIPILRETISQYIYLIKKLTQQNLNKKMSQDIVNRILRDENSLNAYKEIVNAHNSVIQHVINHKLIYILENNISDIEVFFDKETLLNYSAGYKSFYFLNEKLRDLNLKIEFTFNSVSGYSNFIFSLDRLSNDKPAIHLSKLQDVFKLFFGNAKPRESWRCYSDYSNYYNWEDFNTLQKIWFGDDFKEDLIQKIIRMLEIIEKIKSGEIQ